MSSAALQLPPDAAQDLPDLYEVVNNQIEDKSLMSTRSEEIGSDLVQLLGGFVRPNRLGKVLCEALFRIDQKKNLQRRPDVAFVSAAKWPPNKPTPDASAWDMVPDLAVEVDSPTNRMRKMMAKVREYFDAGVQRVWIVLPQQQSILVFDSPSQVRIVTQGDMLEDAALFPGFRLPLVDLFGEIQDYESESASATSPSG